MTKNRFTKVAAATTLTALAFSSPADAGPVSWLKEKLFGKDDKPEIVQPVEVKPVNQAYSDVPSAQETPLPENIEIPNPSIYQMNRGKTVIDDCVGCETSDYVIKSPSQHIGRAQIARHLSEARNANVHIHGYDRQAFENHKAIVDPFCGQEDYVEIQMPQLSDEQRKAGYSLEFWTPSKDNTGLEQRVMAVESDGVVRITRDELSQLPQDDNGYHILKTKNFLVLKDEKGKICASYELQYNAVLNAHCEPVPGTGPQTPAPSRPAVQQGRPSARDDSPRGSSSPRGSRPGVERGTESGSVPSAYRPRPSRPGVRPSRPEVGRSEKNYESQDSYTDSYTEAEISVGAISNTFDSLSSIGEEVSADFDGFQLKGKLEKFANRAKIRGTAVFTSGSGELNVHEPDRTDEDGDVTPGENYTIPVEETAVNLGLKGDFKIVGNRIALVAGGTVEYKSIDISEDERDSGYPQFGFDAPSIVDQQNLYMNARAGLGFFEKNKGFAGNFFLAQVGMDGQKINENYLVGNAEFHPSSSVEYAPVVSAEFRFFGNDERSWWVDGEARYGPEVKTAYTSMFNGLELVGEGESSYQNLRLGFGGKLGSSGNVFWKAGVNYAHNEETFKIDPAMIQELEEDLGNVFDLPSELPSSHDGMSINAGVVFRW